MSHALSSLSLSLPAAVVLALAGSANAADGNIVITGEITDTTCNISVNGAGNNATVVLPTVSADSLSAAGATAGATPFSITLSGCSGSSLNTASTWFEPGPTVDGTTGRLNNTGDAENVQVELLNSDLDSIVVGSPSQNDVPVDISGGSGTLNYYARYYATDAAEAGTVNTFLQYTVIYE